MVAIVAANVGIQECAGLAAGTTVYLCQCSGTPHLSAPSKLVTASCPRHSQAHCTMTALAHRLSTGLDLYTGHTIV